MTMVVWQALWERLLSISESVAQGVGEEHATEALKPLVDFWMHTVRPHREALLSIDQTERNHAGENYDRPCLLQLLGPALNRRLHHAYILAEIARNK